MIDLRLLLEVFGVIFVAELPDKTALAALVLATRHRALPVFIGTGLALTVQSIVAIAAGRVLAFLPPRAVHVGAGVLFLVAAVFMWRRHDDDDSEKQAQRADAGFLRSAWLVFGVVFIAEWGDLTQIATAALAARYNARLTVFLGATAALWAVAGIAVFVGNRAGKLLDPSLTKRIAAVIFAVLGALLIAGVL